MPPIHTRVSEALSDPSTWAAMAGPLGVLATQVPEPWSYGVYTLTAVATIIGIVLRGGVTEGK